jgi:hypothetical protein
LDGVTATAAEMDAYDAKYVEHMKQLGATPEQFHQEYSVPLRVTPDKLRGF